MRERRRISSRRRRIAREHAGGRLPVGFWFWETERLPEVYQRSSSLLDEIWVASEYVAEAVGTSVAKPVRICPLPVRQVEPVPLSRAELGLPEGLLFLFMFDCLSSVHRTNPIGLGDAFCRAFRPGEGPTLMLKSINGPLARGASVPKTRLDGLVASATALTTEEVLKPVASPL